MPDFVRTGTVLDKILANTASEIAARKDERPSSTVLAAAEAAPSPRDMLAALRRGEQVALIAEVKHASPSRGVLIENFEPLRLATTYAENGAAAISVLTDESFFQGHLDYLKDARKAVDVPLLRKDFIIDPYQVYEGRAAGADTILLIVAALDDQQLSSLHSLTLELGMSALVEVHNEADLDRAMKISPSLLGVNNRDLKTFDVDLQTTGRLIELLPDEITFVAESGILRTDDVRHMGALGAHAVLVGEALVTSGDLGSTVNAFSTQPRVKRKE